MRHPRRFAHALGSRVVSHLRAVPAAARRRSSIGCSICSTPTRRTSTFISTARRSCSRTTSRSGPSRSRGSARAIEAGRILIGPWYVMPDEFLVSGESLVRNLAARAPHRAHGSARRCRSATCRISSATSAQMPQIWRQFGLDNTILWRGFGGTRRRVLVGRAGRLARADDAPAAGRLLQRDAHRVRSRRR